jgi:nucleotide-binding universal stress UspA family protein
MKILVGIDDAEFSEIGANAVIALVKTKGTVIRLLHVFEPFPVALAEELGSKEVPDFAAARLIIRNRAKLFLTQAADTLRSAGFDVSYSLEEGDPRQVILDHAEQWLADLIVVGSHRRTGIKGLLMGSVSEAVAHIARCSVQIVRIRSDSDS